MFSIHLLELVVGVLSYLWKTVSGSGMRVYIPMYVWVPLAQAEDSVISEVYQIVLLVML